MGAQLAVHGKQQQAVIDLNHFSDVIVVKLELEKLGHWVIFGRVPVDNFDGDDQTVTAKIIHDANVIIDEINIYAGGKTRHCLAVQATLKSNRSETVVLACSTYKGIAEFGSLIAFNVDNLIP
jgi:hypothetical protein